MDLSKQVISLELAQKLKDLGVKQESLFCWKPDGGWHLSQKFGQHSISAFTVAELGDILSSTSYNWQNAKYDHEAAKGRWFISDYSNKLPVQVEETEADARAKMLVYLIENKLINL